MTPRRRPTKKKTSSGAAATSVRETDWKAVAVTDDDDVLQHYAVEVVPGIPGVPSALCGQSVEGGILVALRYGYDGPALGLPGSEFEVSYEDANPQNWKVRNIRIMHWALKRAMYRHTLYQVGEAGDWIFEKPFHLVISSHPELLQKAKANAHLQALDYLDEPLSAPEPDLEKSMLSLSRVWTVLLRFVEEEQPSLLDSYSYHIDDDNNNDRKWQKVSLLEELREKYIYKLSKHASSIREQFRIKDDN
jgi:hypothetical protein